MKDENLKKYFCGVCGKGPYNEIAITNVNPVGIPSNWLCDVHNDAVVQVLELPISDNVAMRVGRI